MDPDAFLRENAQRLSLIHVRDYRLGGDRTVALGEGDVDYSSLGKLLEELDFTGDLVVELALPSGTRPDIPILASSREVIRSSMEI